MKVTDPGPLIFKHKRIGKSGQPIFVSKFRSLRTDMCDIGGQLAPAFKAYLKENPAAAEEWKETMKLKDDPRISRIGKILRKTSLDELPQFFNVLTGSLSMVGPRPILQEEVVRYGETARILFTVRPGVTGLWQVSGRNDVSYDERVSLDARYIERWNLLGDVVICFKTAGVLISSILGRGKKGAY